MFKLDSGEVVAVLADENSEAYKVGIKNGTAITKWNGEDIDSAIDAVECVSSASYPVKENENTVKPIFLAGKGGEKITVSFLDDNKKEQTVTLSSMGSYRERLNNALDKFSSFPSFMSNEEFAALSDEEKNAAFEEYKNINANFRTKMLTADCGYIAINSEEYDVVSDIIAMVRGKYPAMTEMVNQKLEELKSQGMTKLVIDTRNNGGGFPEISAAIAALFTKEKMFHYSYGKNNSGEYLAVNKNYVNSDGRFADMKVVVLTNLYCASSGDDLVNLLSKCPNITVMGMTCSNGVCQSVGGGCITPDSEFIVNYPVFLNLNEDNTPYIDTKFDRVSRIPLDEKIPVTKESVEVIFGDNDRDYELEYAVEYLNK